MTHVDDSVMWCSPFLHASRYAPDSPDRHKWEAFRRQAMVNRGIDAKAAMELARNLPFGYIGSEGT